MSILEASLDTVTRRRCYKVLCAIVRRRIHVASNEPHNYQKTWEEWDLWHKMMPDLSEKAEKSVYASYGQDTLAYSLQWRKANLTPQSVRSNYAFAKVLQ